MHPSVARYNVLLQNTFPKVRIKKFLQKAKNKMMCKIWILTGEKQIGKTTFLQQWVETRHDVAGFLSPVVAGKRFFYNIENQTFTPMEISTSEQAVVLKVGRFQFSTLVFEQVEQNILAMLQNKITAKIVVIDEIGSLELEQKKGLYHTLISLLSNSLDIDVLFVVRSSLLTNMCDLITIYQKPYNIFQLPELKKFLQNLEQ